jgi:hypothetical protein
MTLRLTFAAFCIAALGACDTSPTLPEPANKLVVQAYLYAGQPVTNVRLTVPLAIGADGTDGIPVNTAQVALIRRGTRYTLTASPGDSGFYHYTGADLTVTEGDVFDLEVRYGAIVATARTTVPNPPGVVMLSADSVIVPSFGGRGGFGGQLNYTPLVARWPNPSRELYYVTIESADSSAAAIGGGRGAPRRFIFPPVAADSFTVVPFSLSYYGLHNIHVYRVNAEYAALYESRQQDTRGLNEPATNIRNGLGVFTAFSSRTLQFRAVPGG